MAKSLENNTKKDVAKDKDLSKPASLQKFTN
jgi:hypothetical protein